MHYTAMSSADYLGHSISKTNPILIIDLDNTLLSINSFHVWAAYFLFGKFEKLNFKKRGILLLKAAKIFAERKIFRRSHEQTKSNLHKLWLKTDDNSALENILAALKQKIRPNIWDVLELIAQNKFDGALATAASSLYAEPFAKHIGFLHIISTNLNEKENRGEEKSRRILELISAQKWEDREKIFFTDHLEDMPFILKSDKLMWFGKAEEIGIIEKSAPELNIIVCNNLTSGEILEAINNDKQTDVFGRIQKEAQTAAERE